MNPMRTQLTNGENIFVEERTDEEIWKEWDRVVEQWIKAVDPFDAVHLKDEDWDER